MITNINDQKTLEEFVKEHRFAIIADAMEQYASSIDEDHWGSYDNKGLQCDYNAFTASIEKNIERISIWAYGIADTPEGAQVNTQVGYHVGYVEWEV